MTNPSNEVNFLTPDGQNSLVLSAGVNGKVSSLDAEHASFSRLQTDPAPTGNPHPRQFTLPLNTPKSSQMT
jgi:hypothetical protein